MQTPRPNLDRRRELCGADVTLDGAPAVVCGARNDFATVATLPNGNAVEFAWQTVETVIAAGGRFKS